MIDSLWSYKRSDLDRRSGLFSFNAVKANALLALMLFCAFRGSHSVDMLAVVRIVE